MIRHLFFDLDHTLWDFETNASACIIEIFETFVDHIPVGLTAADFYPTFSAINQEMWQRLDRHLISHEYLRKTRFLETFEVLNCPISEEMSLAMNDAFLDLLPTKGHLMPEAHRVLQTLSGKYALHVLSNGYYPIQTQKMKSGGILHFFDKIITFDIAQARKPEKEIFEFAMAAVAADTKHCLMIGDNPVADIQGAQNVGMRAIHFDENHLETSDKKISKLSDLLRIL
jgi:YjjG family noncanonical pyrimidine nucleotidase